MAAMIKVGTAQRDITPPAGAAMGAFPVNRSPMQPRIAEGTHDPLYARALALSDDTTTLVICSADLLSFQWIDVDDMRNAFAAQSGLPRS
jgi:neutral ceramidase